LYTGDILIWAFKLLSEIDIRRSLYIQYEYR